MKSRAKESQSLGKAICISLLLLLMCLGGCSSGPPAAEKKEFLEAILSNAVKFSPERGERLIEMLEKTPSLANVVFETRQGATPLTLFSGSGNTQEGEVFGLRMIDSLLKHGADPNAKLPHSGPPSGVTETTTMHIYAKYSKAKKLAKILDAGGKVNARDSGGNTPLMYALFNLSTAELLIERGADVAATNNEGETVRDKANKVLSDSLILPTSKKDIKKLIELLK